MIDYLYKYLQIWVIYIYITMIYDCHFMIVYDLYKYLYEIWPIYILKFSIYLYI